MEQQVINQEILLFTGSSFCNRRFCERNDQDNNDYSAMEELEKACWDGMLYEMLPELVETANARKDNCIWNTTSGVNFLCVNLGTFPVPDGKQTSINPYFSLWGAGRTN